MKLNHTLLTLIAAALLPTAAYASNYKPTVSANNDSHCIKTITMEVAVPREYPFLVSLEQLEQGEIKTLSNKTDDPVLISYYRDFYHWPDPVRSMEFTTRQDPYLDATTLALYGQNEIDLRYAC